MEKPCEIYYVSCSEVCMKCGMIWDANDPYPPQCKIDQPVKLGWLDRLITRIFGDRQA